MAFNLFSPPNFAAFPNPTISIHHSSTIRNQLSITKCESNESSSSSDIKLGAKAASKLEIGSPIIVIEAPQVLKTAASIPCLRPNSGLVKPGDVGRIVSRKPKEVWAVRLSIGTYLLDSKYFKPLELDE